MTPLQEFQVETIEDTLRLCANYMNAYDRDTCLSRHVMLCWNWCYDALHDVDSNTTSQNGVMYRMRKGQMPGDDNKKMTMSQFKKHGK